LDENLHGEQGQTLLQIEQLGGLFLNLCMHMRGRLCLLLLVFLLAQRQFFPFETVEVLSGDLLLIRLQHEDFFLQY